jgi:hypothetical protein
MASLTRRASEERQQAVLRFFIENPTATGEEAQRALRSGRLLPDRGRDQPPMGLGMLFRVKRQAKSMAAQGIRPNVATRTASQPLTQSAQLNDEQLQALRDRGRHLQELLSKMPETVLEVHVSRHGVSILRAQTTKEDL